jgi:hypothetical protein
MYIHVVINRLMSIYKIKYIYMYDRRYLFLIKKKLGLSEFTNILICVLLHFPLLHFAMMSTENVIYRGLLHFASLLQDTNER